MVGHEGIAQGIVGLVAGKLAEEAYRPAIVYERGEQWSRGSARSIPELDVWRCLSQADDLLQRWGGHSQAGGFTVATSNLPALKDRLSRWVERELEGFELQPALTADLEYPLRSLRGDVIALLPYFEPCGQENPKPVLISRRVLVMRSWTVGAEGRHLRLKLRDGQGSATWDAVGFGLGHALPRPGTAVDVLYTLGRDRRGMSELHLQDFAPAG
jgi:single-stranded-DNA-specific exonuclease